MPALARKRRNTTCSSCCGSVRCSRFVDGICQALKVTLDHSGQLKTTWADKLSHPAALLVVSIQHLFRWHCKFRDTCKDDMCGIPAVLIIFAESDWFGVLYMYSQPDISWFRSIVSLIEGCGSVSEQTGRQLSSLAL